MEKKLLFLVFVLLVSIGSAVSQSYKTKHDHTLEIFWANDFVFETDRYFTNGLNLTYYTSALNKSPVNYILLPAKNAEHVFYGLTIIQDFFTPVELFSTSIDTHDRPFASYLLIGERKVSLNSQKGLKVHSEILVGILGKYSGGESIQNGIHDILPPSEPALGWSNQIQPDLAMNYLVRIEKSLVRNPYFNVLQVIDLKAGIPYTNAGAVIKLRAGRMNDYFSDNGFTKNKPWQLYFLAEMGGKYVFYNATMQGGLINENPYVMSSISHWVGQFKSGITFSIGGFGIELGQQYITREFDSGMSHKWGYLTFRFAF